MPGYKSSVTEGTMLYVLRPSRPPQAELIEFFLADGIRKCARSFHMGWECDGKVRSHSVQEIRGHLTSSWLSSWDETETFGKRVGNWSGGDRSGTTSGTLFPAWLGTKS